MVPWGMYDDVDLELMVPPNPDPHISPSNNQGFPLTRSEFYQKMRFFVIYSVKMSLWRSALIPNWANIF